MAKRSSDHDRYSRDEFLTYLDEHFGDEVDTYMLSRNQQQVLFGKIVRLMRETRRLSPEPLSEGRIQSRWVQPSLFGSPQDFQASRESSCVLNQEDDGSDTPDTAGTSNNTRVMPQAELAAAMQAAWWYLHHDKRYFDASWIRRLENGAVILDRPLILCLAYSLDAEDKEIAILLEAAGYSGWNAYKAYRLKAPRATIMGWLEEGADNHRSKKFAPRDILTLIKYRMEAEIRDATPLDDPQNRDRGDSSA